MLITVLIQLCIAYYGDITQNNDDIFQNEAIKIELMKIFDENREFLAEIENSIDSSNNALTLEAIKTLKRFCGFDDLSENLVSENKSIATDAIIEEVGIDDNNTTEITRDNIKTAINVILSYINISGIGGDENNRFINGMVSILSALQENTA